MLSIGPGELETPGRKDPQSTSKTVSLVDGVSVVYQSEIYWAVLDFYGYRAALFVLYSQIDAPYLARDVFGSHNGQL
jgi:hypothetical protein